MTSSILDRDILEFIVATAVIGSFQKRSIPHSQRKFPPSREGNHLKNALNLYRMSREGRGVLLISSMGGGGGVGWIFSGTTHYKF